MEHFRGTRLCNLLDLFTELDISGSKIGISKEFELNKYDGVQSLALETVEKMTKEKMEYTRDLKSQY